MDLPKVLVCLQNVYDKGLLETGWHPTRWRQEFKTSRTGHRLSLMLPDDIKVHFCNVAPGIGEGPSSLLIPSQRHLKRVLNRTQPDYVVACGRIAEEALLAAWDGNLLVIPHPASRVLTNSLLRKAKEILTCKILADLGSPIECEIDVDQDLRLALRQRRGFTELEDLSYQDNPDDEWN